MDGIHKICSTEGKGHQKDTHGLGGRLSDTLTGFTRFHNFERETKQTDIRGPGRD